MVDDIGRSGRSRSIPRPAHPEHRLEPLPGQRPKSAEDDTRAPEALRNILWSPSYLDADQDIEFLKRRLLAKTTELTAAVS